MASSSQAEDSEPSQDYQDIAADLGLDVEDEDKGKVVWFETFKHGVGFATTMHPHTAVFAPFIKRGMLKRHYTTVCPFEGAHCFTGKFGDKLYCYFITDLKKLPGLCRPAVTFCANYFMSAFCEASLTVAKFDGTQPLSTTMSPAQFVDHLDKKDKKTGFVTKFDCTSIPTDDHHLYVDLDEGQTLAGYYAQGEKDRGAFVEKAQAQKRTGTIQTLSGSPKKMKA